MNPNVNVNDIENENLNQNQNNQRNGIQNNLNQGSDLQLNNLNYMDKLTSRDFLEICKDFIPSIVILSLLYLSYVYSNVDSPCITNFSIFFTHLTYISLGFLLRSFIRMFLIGIDKINNAWIKFSFNLSDLALYL